MKPYFEAEGITLYHGDARDILPTLASDSVDLVLTDPPYGVAWESGQRGDSFGPIVGDQDQSVGLAVLALVPRLMRSDRHAYVFGRWNFDGLAFSPPTELIWDKTLHAGGDLALPWGAQHEYIQFVTNRSNTSRSSRAGHPDARPARIRRGSVLRYQRPNGLGVNRHPTEKPVPLLRELIECSSRMGELVLDPFAGSGSTLVAAQFEGRHAVGIEIEERYCEVAAKRLDQLVLPLEAV